MRIPRWLLVHLSFLFLHHLQLSFSTPTAATAANNAAAVTTFSIEEEADDDPLHHPHSFHHAKQLLDAFSIFHTCHPTRSDLPDFPLCDDEPPPKTLVLADEVVDAHDDIIITTATTRSDRPHRRRQRQRSLEDYYAFIDDDDWYHIELVWEPEWHFNLVRTILAVVCVLVNSLACGLTVGLLSLDPLVLMIKARTGDAIQAAQAHALLPLVKQRHLLLVTLLLLNTAACSTLPVLLHVMMPELFVIILSVALMMFFGEIIPSAVCLGSNQLAIAGSMADLVRVIMWLVYPIAYPIAKILDCVVSHDGCASSSNYTRNELAALIRLQYEAKMEERARKELATVAPVTPHIHHHHSLTGSMRNLDSYGGNVSMQAAAAAAAVMMVRRTNSSLDLDEVMMAEGALALRSRSAADLVISHRKIFSISYDTELNDQMIAHIYSSGYSRVPVYRGDDPKKICGILMTRQLILVKATDQKKVSDLPLLLSPRCIGPDMDLLELVNLFQTGGGCAIGRTRRSAGHMAIVCARPDVANAALQADGDAPIPKAAGLMGIITMEDVLEALLQEQIYDEMDAAGRVCSLNNSDSCSVSTESTAAHNMSRSSRPNYYHYMQHQQRQQPSLIRFPTAAAPSSRRSATTHVDATSYTAML
jgi:CBS domain containing-hemolysin-like protein